MDYQLIANIFLAVAGFFTLAVMLKWDMLSLQLNAYSNKQMMEWLQSTDESYSTKRIVPMAALVACATPWARQSWIVVALLALIMIVLAVVMLRTKHEKSLSCNKRSIWCYIAVLVIVAACGISLFTARFSLEAGMLMMLFTAFSYVLAMGANWIASIFSKSQKQ